MRTTIKIFSFLFLILGLIACSANGPSGSIEPANKSVDTIAEFDAESKTVLIDGQAVPLEINEGLMARIREAVEGVMDPISTKEIIMAKIQGYIQNGLLIVSIFEKLGVSMKIKGKIYQNENSSTGYTIEGKREVNLLHILNNITKSDPAAINLTSGYKYFEDVIFDIRMKDGMGVGEGTFSGFVFKGIFIPLKWEYITKPEPKKEIFNGIVTLQETKSNFILNHFKKLDDGSEEVTQFYLSRSEYYKLSILDQTKKYRAYGVITKAQSPCENPAQLCIALVVPPKFELIWIRNSSFELSDQPLVTDVSKDDFLGKPQKMIIQEAIPCDRCGNNNPSLSFYGQIQKKEGSYTFVDENGATYFSNYSSDIYINFLYEKMSEDLIYHFHGSLNYSLFSPFSCLEIIDGTEGGNVCTLPLSVFSEKLASSAKKTVSQLFDK